MLDLSNYKVIDDESFINYLIDRGAISYGNFVGKSEQTYSVETDIRNVLSTVDSAMFVAHNIYKRMIENNIDNSIIGVPETGSFLALYINLVRRMYQEDFSINMLRTVPKEYQGNTNSIYTVLPLKTSEKYTLVEDDVVTGNTLLKYLNNCLQAGINITDIVVVFGRNRADNLKKICDEKNISYYELFSVDEIERRNK